MAWMLLRVVSAMACSASSGRLWPGEQHVVAGRQAAEDVVGDHLVDLSSKKRSSSSS
jgi:hypothetical protein